MSQLGYIAKGENGIDGRRYFRKGSDIHHSHHIHTYQDGHPEVVRHLNFRDYLIAHPDVAQAYSRLKEELARKYVTSPPNYTNSKTDFIRDVAGKAVVWRNHQAIETERLMMLPLTEVNLQTSLTNQQQLAQDLGITLADGLFDHPMPQVIDKKLAKISHTAAGHYLWATYWLIIPQEALVGVGLVGFKGMPNANGEAEIGYGMHPNFQNKGYMTEAVMALVDWALAQPECTAVTAETESDNLSSIRVLEKVGMRKVGVGNGRLLWKIEM
jgi:predicted acetyltransferase